MKEEYIDINNGVALMSLSEAILSRLSNIERDKDIIVLCIGTDRSTGDSLGPLVGYKLKNMSYSRVHVLGSLEKPIHAKNLAENLEKIKTEYKNPYVIAVDASLGKATHVGLVTVGNGPIKPGAGLDKKLPETGDMHVTGIVNFGGMMEFMILQNTRLATVMKMADIISSALRYALWNYIEAKNISPSIKKTVFNKENVVY